MSRLAVLRVAGAGLALLTSAWPTSAQVRDGVPELMPGVPAGYLLEDEKLDSVALLPAPPGSGSESGALDQQMHNRAAALRGTPRWELAKRDASLAPDDAVGAFACAVGIEISRTGTPRLYQMLQRVMVDAGTSADGAKRRYQALRPFVVNGETMCTPEEDAELRADGSYPSGHTALGWGAALALVEVAPDRANQIIARGRSFGESRMICNVHWQSDILAGRFMAGATVAKIHSNPHFREDMAIARQEYLRARDDEVKPSRDCNAESSALAIRLPGAL
ncbi:acid phosphatase [Kaistia sp. 32K]|uniref:acid phosphatase n=1 Tax=Kaistia sp. 32K TaxID=2795690 RepID=UPI00191580D3|nr:phosphatase PAP2 family protein [Kaistia sp. 32K]BCP55600.1 acid phosphatase [Kaistia sp. 32K]